LSCARPIEYDPPPRALKKPVLNLSAATGTGFGQISYSWYWFWTFSGPRLAVRPAVSVAASRYIATETKI
jgi:hypothetical protein